MNYSNLQIQIDEKAMCKLQYYSEYAKEEVGGLLEIERTKDKIFVKDILIMDQTASFGEFELDSEALSKFMAKLIKSPRLNKICGWWHKHPIANWSGHDDSTFEKLRSYFKGFCLGIVMQDVHQQDNKFTPLIRLEVGKVKEYGLLKNNILQFQTPYMKIIKSKKFSRSKLRQKCKKEIDKYVKEPKPIDYTYYGNDYNNEYAIEDDEDMVYDKKLGYWVFKIKQKKKNTLQSTLNSDDLVFIDGVGYDLKYEIGCKQSFHCLDCEYCDDCIKETKYKDKIRSNYRNY